MCQFTQLKKVEPLQIFEEKECRFLQGVLSHITAMDDNKK